MLTRRFKLNMPRCKYCQGRGCLYCPPPEEPPSPGLLASFRLDDPSDMELAKQAIGGPALARAFASGGGGVDEIINNCRNASLIQAIRQAVKAEDNDG